MSKEDAVMSWEWMVNIEKQYAGKMFLTCELEGRRFSVSPKSQYDMPFTRTNEPCGVVGVRVMVVPTDFSRFKVVPVTGKDRKRFYSTAGLNFGGDAEVPDRGHHGVMLQEIIDFTERFERALIVLPKKKISMELLDWERLSELQGLSQEED